MVAEIELRSKANVTLFEVLALLCGPCALWWRFTVEFQFEDVVWLSVQNDKQGVP